MFKIYVWTLSKHFMYIIVYLTVWLAQAVEHGTEYLRAWDRVRQTFLPEDLYF